MQRSFERAAVGLSSPPRWEVGDLVEVAWAERGFNGAWHGAQVIQKGSDTTVLVRFDDYVNETDGSALVEEVNNRRLRIAPPAAPPGWTPYLHQQVECYWNDSWWEGVVLDFHAFKGVLFGYAHYNIYAWVPLRTLRPRTPLYAFYHIDRAPADEKEEICGSHGCILPKRHAGICEVRVSGSRRDKMRKRSECAKQEELWTLVTTTTKAKMHTRRARAEGLRRAQGHGVKVKVSFSNTSQWSSNFMVDEFSAATRDIGVVGVHADGRRERRGILIVYRSMTLADARANLRTELNVPTNASVLVVPSGDETRASCLDDINLSYEVWLLLPDEPCELWVRPKDRVRG